MIWVYLIGILIMASFVVVESIPTYLRTEGEDARKEFALDVLSSVLMYAFFWPVTVVVLVWLGLHKIVGFFVDFPKKGRYT